MTYTSPSLTYRPRTFFFEVIKPILERNFPEETSRTTFGVFGYGSEVLRLDNEYSADHHWGMRINALMPETLFEERAPAILRVVKAEMPDTSRGHNLREGLSVAKACRSPAWKAICAAQIGLTKVPRPISEWLSMPEEDITHVINGEIWLDETGQFSAIRKAFLRYCPEPVRLGMAHWCRYYSGMGSYALKRALLRYNEWYAAVAFARAIRLGVQLAFLLDKQYCPYDKWTMAFFAKLPRMYFPLAPIVNEAVSLATPWSRKLELLNEMADVLDQPWWKMAWSRRIRHTPIRRPPATACWSTTTPQSLEACLRRYGRSFRSGTNSTWRSFIAATSHRWIWTPGIAYST